MDYQHYFDCPCFGLANPCSGCAYMQEQLMKTWEFLPLDECHSACVHCEENFFHNSKPRNQVNMRILAHDLSSRVLTEQKRSKEKKVNLFVTEDRCGEKEPRNIRVLILVYVCPHNTICVLILLYRREGDLQ